MRPMRKNLLVDFGKTINQLGAELIETPDEYKRINNIGEIVGVGPDCKLFDKSCIGNKVIISITRHEEDRIPPHKAKEYGLKPHWHFYVNERLVDAMIE